MIKGVNFGNWLVLEKWMFPELFAGTDAEDETYLGKALSPQSLHERLALHREEYIRERDFMYLKNHGINTIRIPVPWFIFEDASMDIFGPYVGGIEYLDRAFDWAEKYGLKILIDQHTAPGSQNGFDNGGICGICVWAKTPAYVEQTLVTLEKLAERYGDRDGLYGIQILNEPISPEMFTMIQQRYIPVDKDYAAVSAAPSHDFLVGFYQDAYRRMRRYLPEDKAVVFHDNFQLKAWKEFMRGSEWKNVVLDTHQYLGFMPDLRDKPVSEAGAVIERIGADLKEMREYFPIVVGEWCVSNGTIEAQSDDPFVKASAYMQIARQQLRTFEENSDGWFFWSYKLNSNAPGWDYLACTESGWFPDKV